LWDIIFYFYASFIHVGNPKIIVYLDKRFKSFKTIYETTENPLDLRNNVKIRTIFTELITILCLSNKMYVLNYAYVPNDDYNMAFIHTKYKAPNDNYITPYYKQDDPKHMIHLFNEFVYNIEIGNSSRAFYWFEYILGYEKLLHKYNEKSISTHRDFVNVKHSHKRDIIWIIWEILIRISQNKGHIYNSFVQSCLSLFTIRYSLSSKQSKKYFIYCSILFITSNIDITKPLLESDFDMEKIHKTSTIIYSELLRIKEIKTNNSK
jgi:hypothetical protein